MKNMNNKNSDLSKKSPKFKQKSEKIEKAIPEDVGEVIEKLTPPDQEKIFSFIRQSTFSFMAPMINPVIAAIIEKCSSKDFTSLIQNMENESIRDDDQKKLTKKIDFLKFIIGSVLLIFLCVFFTLTNNPSLLKDVITYIVLVAGGAGYGIYQFYKRKGEI